MSELRHCDRKEACSPAWRHEYMPLTFSPVISARSFGLSSGFA